MSSKWFEMQKKTKLQFELVPNISNRCMVLCTCKQTSPSWLGEMQSIALAKKSDELPTMAIELAQENVESINLTFRKKNYIYLV